MSDLRTAAKQALEALEAIHEADTAGATPKMVIEARSMYEPTITALKAALVEDAMQKFTDVNQELEAELADTKVDSKAIAKLLGPAAWQWLDTGHYRKKLPAKADASHWRPLYAAPNIPPEAQTEAEKIAYCAGWWDALAAERKTLLSIAAKHS